MNHPLDKWDPIKEFNQLGQRLSSLFSHKHEAIPGTGALLDMESPEWNPAVDITEDDDEYLVTADLPEVKKEEVKVSIDNGVLTIAGERKTESEKKDKKKKYHRIERSYGSYQRTFRLPDNIAEDQVEAEFKDGVLRVHLPKGKSVEQKTIQVK